MVPAQNSVIGGNRNAFSALGGLFGSKNRHYFLLCRQPHTASGTESTEGR